ncbi:hypothetical protein D3C78_1926810 [compost metagenome]
MFGRNIKDDRGPADNVGMVAGCDDLIGSKKPAAHEIFVGVDTISTAKWCV